MRLSELYFKEVFLALDAKANSSTCYADGFLSRCLSFTQLTWVDNKKRAAF